MPQAIETLQQFYDAVLATVPVRRRVVDRCLDNPPAYSYDVDLLAETLARLKAIPGAPAAVRLQVQDAISVTMGLEYEIEELTRDLLFLQQGEDALLRYLHARHPGARTQIAALRRQLSGLRFGNLITDRDGTVNNYCGRYLSSVQSAYNAVFLARFARHCVRNAVILTSAPLENMGLVDISVTPRGDILLAGSKGRECRDRVEQRLSCPVAPRQQDAIDTLNGELQQLLGLPEYRVFTLIGSGFQRKFGQTTVARQDIAGSIPPEQSAAFLHTVEQLVARLDPTRQHFRIEDTGKDIEILLTVADDRGALQDFDKGHGVAFLDSALGLRIAESPCLVCGDTTSDIAMVLRCAAMNPDTYAIFVTTDEALRARLRNAHANSMVVDTPDTLVLLFKELAE